MDAGLDQLDRLLNAPLDTFTDRAVAVHESEIVKLNTDQLDAGINANGQSLGEYSSIKYKGRKKPVDLLLTGAFRGGFSVDPDTGGFLINTTDPKAAFLDKKYPDNRGLTDENTGTVAELILPDILDQLHEVI